MTRLIPPILSLFFFSTARSQNIQPDTSGKGQVYERIMQAMAGFTPDTSAPPEDRLTRKIRKLRQLRGGFNINEMLEFKLAEERQKKEKPAAHINSLSDFFSQGNGKRWLDHAAIWIYRKQYNYRDIKRMVRYYRSATGQKSADLFPVIMVQLILTAETLTKNYEQAGKR